MRMGVGVVKAKKLTAKNCGKHVQDKFLDHLDEILAGFLKTAKRGGYMSMRLVLEILAKGTEKKRGPAEVLMAELKRQRAKKAREAGV